MRRARIIGFNCLLLLALASCGEPNEGSSISPQFVVVYTSMEDAQLAQLYEGFTAASGIRVQQVSGDFDRLLEMMHDRQRQPAADVFLAKSSATLWYAASADILRPTYSDRIRQSVPALLRDTENLFAAFAISANAIVFDDSRAGGLAPKDYESLAGPEWRGKLCLTSSSRAENVAWISLLLARHGKREAEMIVRRLVANLAAPVFDDVTELVAAMESGRCGVAIADLRSSVLRLSGHADAGVTVITPTAANGGTQLDIVGAGVTRHAANAEGAVRFLEWLASDDGQQAVVESGVGLPVSTTVRLQLPLGRYQVISPAEINVSQLGSLSQDAIALVERAHYP